MYHVRRKFVEASKAAPAAKKRSKKAKVGKADSALSQQSSVVGLVLRYVPNQPQTAALLPNDKYM